MSTILSNTADREMIITRLVNAPQALVFKVWTEPNHVGNWWGPKGFTTTTLEMDVRPGGIWRFIMHGPNGMKFKDLVEYMEVVPTEKLVYLHSDFENPDFKPFKATITFEDQGDKTLITMKTVFDSPETLANMRKFGAEAGGNSTLDCLEEYLTNL